MKEKTYKTDLGRTITAESRQRAQMLAREYNMGRIVGTAPTPRRGATFSVASEYVAWDPLAEAEHARGHLHVVAEVANENPDLVVMAVGPRGLRKMNRVERNALKRLLSNAG